MKEQLTAQGWIDFALKTLAREGAEALKADVLARKLGVSRGSFYWHFSELGDFHARLVVRWRDIATEAIIADLAQYQSARRRLAVLLRAALSRDARLEVRMRAFADTNARAARAVAAVDRRRRRYIEQLLVGAGVARPLAATRAQLLYWAYLGAALGRGKLAGAALARAVDALMRLAFAGAGRAGRGRKRRR